MEKKKKVEFSNTLCATLEILASIVRKRLGAEITRTKAFKDTLKKGPMVILSNHTSNYDFIYISSAMYGHKLNFMVAENLKYVSPTYNKLITKYHAISKRQYYSDIKSIKGVKTNIDNGISVLICPEGKVAANGVTGVIPESISRLLQWLNCDVGVIKVEGGGLKLPKWASNTRKGKVQITCDLLIKKEELKELSKTEIYQKVCSAIYHNNHKWQEDNNIIIKDENLAKGLHGLLYKCPRCGKEFNMNSSGCTIKCDSCGLEGLYNSNGKLTFNDGFKGPERVDLWYDMQVADVDKELETDFKDLSIEVDLNMENDTHDGYKKISSGVLKIDRENIQYKSIEESEFSTLNFPLKDMETICFIPGLSCEIYDDKHVYKFVFNKEFASTKYAILVEELYKKSHLR